MFEKFSDNILTADPKEHIKRAKLLLDFNNNALLLYAALELRLAAERLQHNQLSLSEHATINNKKGNDPKKKKLIMNNIDPDSDFDSKIYYNDSKSGNRIYWGEYKNISTQKIKNIEGRLGNLLHMKEGLKLGINNDPWYTDTRNFLSDTADYFDERLTNSDYYFSFTNLDNFELVKNELRCTTFCRST